MGSAEKVVEVRGQRSKSYVYKCVIAIYCSLVNKHLSLSREEALRSWDIMSLEVKLSIYAPSAIFDLTGVEVNHSAASEDP